MSTTLAAGSYFGETVSSLRAGRFLLTETVYPAGARIGRHRHQHGYLCLVRHGTYQEDVASDLRSCQPLTVAFHPPDETHRQRMDEREVRSFNIDLPADWLNSVLPEKRAWAAEPGTRASWVASRIWEGFERGNAPTEEALARRLRELIDIGDPGEPAPLGPAWLDEVRARLDRDVDRSLSLGDLAGAAGVHPVHLAASFRRRVGSTVGDYRRQRRVAQACVELAAGERSLVEVGLAAGFCDQAHFARTFKRYTGLTPGRFRALYGSGP